MLDTGEGAKPQSRAQVQTMEAATPKATLSLPQINGQGDGAQKGEVPKIGHPSFEEDLQSHPIHEHMLL